MAEKSTFTSGGCSRHKKGTLSDLLECQTKGFKIVNALDFPMPSAPHPPTSIASDLATFVATVDLPLCGCSIPFPVMDCRWGLAATDSAFHKWHIDCDGFGTYIDTQAGQKWWILARSREACGLSDTSFFTERFDLDGDNGDLWISEAILLTPGTRL